MKILPDGIGRLSTPTTPHHKDALAPICEINEQCLNLLVSAARQTLTPPDSPVQHILSLISPLDPEAVKAAARFPFLLVDFGFRDAHWWQRTTSGHGRAAMDLEWLAPLPRAPAIKLARATLTLAWHTVRTDPEASRVLLGITADVAPMVSALRLKDIDKLAERHVRRLRPRWEDQPAVWRQLLTCARNTEIESTRDFVLHALQLTAAAALPRSSELSSPARGVGSANTNSAHGSCSLESENALIGAASARIARRRLTVE